MPEVQEPQQKSQSGAKLALGIFGFMIGVILILWLIKYLTGL
jgi:hypothetical protein